MVLIILEEFPESQKIEDVNDCGPVKNLSFLLLSHFLHVSHPNE